METKKLSKTRDIRLTVKIKATPKKIYQTLTSARALCRWWLEGAETNAKNMGRFRLLWPTIKTGDEKLKRVFPPHTATGEVTGIFVDLEPGKKISWIWEVSPKWKHPPLSTIFIEAHGNHCEVTLVHPGFSTRPRLAKYSIGARAGWEDCLAKLKTYLETGKTVKNQALTLKN